VPCPRRLGEGIIGPDAVEGPDGLHPGGPQLLFEGPDGRLDIDEAKPIAQKNWDYKTIRRRM
jgi:hypothetical protein